MRWSRLAPIALVGLCVLALTGDAFARYEGNLNVFAGMLWLDSSDWTPEDEQPELGLAFAFGEERAPIHFAVDLYASKKEVGAPPNAGIARVKARSREIAIGVRKVWDETPTRPHLGAGATAIHVSETLQSSIGTELNEDRAYGAWVDFGVTWRLASHLNLGLGGRYSYALATIGSGPSARDVSVGGIQMGVLIGYGW